MKIHRQLTAAAFLFISMAIMAQVPFSKKEVKEKMKQVADWHERRPLTLAYSKDEGKTWKNLIELAAAPGNKCQPAMCRDRDGRLNVVYMNRHTAIEHLVLEITE